MSAIVVERAGLLTTVQDAGRWGWQHVGVSVSGWMDDWSARLANRLVGNDDRAAVLEITLTGPALRAEGDLAIAVTGAVFDVTVGQHRLRSPCRTILRSGETLDFGARHRGTRGYLACAGGFATGPVLASRSSDLRAGLGGERLQRGGRYEVGAAAAVALTRELEPPEWLFAGRLRVLAGLEDAQWTSRALAAFCAGPYTISTASDRTGFRLEGSALPAPPGTLLSGPVAAGVVQVPPSGLPILLMADCQTTGGYARLGAIVAGDRAVAGQLGPGDRTTFVEVSRQQAADIAAERHQWLEQMVQSAR